MRKIIILITLLVSQFVSTAFAAGGITHMFIAKEAVKQLPPQLRDVIYQNMDAYLVGAYYPDSGYIANTGYGEDSHWDPFVYAFSDYLREKYPYPAQQNPPLVAFLFGVATHRISDEVTHWTFYPEIAKYDFKGDKTKAEDVADMGIDILVNVEKNQWATKPSVWWVPVKDLLAIYHRMGKDQYTAAEIIRGNEVISIAGAGEKAIATEAYPVYKYIKLQWTDKHYYNWPTGGIVMDVQKVVEYQKALWARLTTPRVNVDNFVSNGSSNKITQQRKILANKTLLNCAQQAIKTNGATTNITTNSDGSVSIRPVISDFQRLRCMKY
ncbi:MAG: hypothetical protein ACD_46C00687G0010 [uncultured bacterium]|nr:MAG: hypothetical protein ACD_46C00687G0010 [uncultured bacterium]